MKAQKEKKKKNRKGETTSQQVDQQLLQVPVLGLSWLLCAINKLM
jgi:hypothetical protein